MMTNPELQNLLSKADRFIGRLDAFSDLIPDIDFFIKTHITKEATVSSRIEGTQTSFQEALVKEGIPFQPKLDWEQRKKNALFVPPTSEEVPDLKTHSLFIGFF